MLDSIEYDPLDDTRVHPKDYDIAKKIAVSTMKNKLAQEEEIDDE